MVQFFDSHVYIVLVCLCVSMQKVKNCWSQVDITWCKYILCLTLEVIKFW